MKEEYIKYLKNSKSWTAEKLSRKYESNSISFNSLVDFIKNNKSYLNIMDFESFKKKEKLKENDYYDK